MKRIKSKTITSKTISYRFLWNARMGLSPSEYSNVLASIVADVPETPEASVHVARALSDMMTEAEEHLGNRLPGCYLGGILFAGDHPRIRNPFSFGDSVYL